jgi:hypothetical protein
MTGVQGRPELIISGSPDGKTWFPYEFHYKPGKMDQAPVLATPHQPRFDWQLWFSALSKGLQSEFYLMHFLYKLFHNSDSI